MRLEPISGTRRRRAWAEKTARARTYRPSVRFSVKAGRFRCRGQNAQGRGPDQRLDIPIGTLKSIEKQAGLKLR